MKNHRQTFNDTPLAFNMIFIKGGTFNMGGESGYDDSLPIHPVTLSDYWIGEVPVTQALWAHVMQDSKMPDPFNFKGDNRPVEQVSWEYITKEFLPKLNKMTDGVRPKGTKYCLPTEAQWEYAARGGKHWKEYSFKYSGSDKINEVAWYVENSHNETKPVGLKTPNLLGLYDMSGNVWEWCSDKRKDYNQNYEDVINESLKDPVTGALINPTGVKEGSARVLRGGSWYAASEDCRPTSRFTLPPTNRRYFNGFRLVLFSPSVDVVSSPTIP